MGFFKRGAADTMLFAAASLPMEISMRFESLAPVSHTGLFSFHWIVSAMDVMLESYSQVKQQVICSLDSNRQRDLVSLVLNQNARMLELCNLIKTGMSRTQCSCLHIKYALHLLASASSSDTNQLIKVKKSVQDCVSHLVSEQMQQQQRQDYYSAGQDAAAGQQSLLWSQTMPPAKKSTRIASQVDEANLIAALVLSVLFVAFPCKESSATWPAAAAETSSLKDFRDEAKRFQGRQGGMLEGFASCLKQVLSTLDGLLQADARVREEEEHKLKLMIHQTSKMLSNFSSGMEVLENQVSTMFKELITTRNVILDSM